MKHEFNDFKSNKVEGENRVSKDAADLEMIPGISGWRPAM